MLPAQEPLQQLQAEQPTWQCWLGLGRRLALLKCEWKLWLLLHIPQLCDARLAVHSDALGHNLISFVPHLGQLPLLVQHNAALLLCLAHRNADQEVLQWPGQVQMAVNSEEATYCMLNGFFVWLTAMLIRKFSLSSLHRSHWLQFAAWPCGQRKAALMLITEKLKGRGEPSLGAWAAQSMLRVLLCLDHCNTKRKAVSGVDRCRSPLQVCRSCRLCFSELCLYQCRTQEAGLAPSRLLATRRPAMPPRCAAHLMMQTCRCSLCQHTHLSTLEAGF